MKRLLFIYNPQAGKGILKAKLADVVDIFVKEGYEVVAYPTQSYQDAYHKMLSCNWEEFDRIVCGGGDGTIDEVVTGMVSRGISIPLGYIPTGTTNDFASSLHIPRDILQAASNAVTGEPFPCDIGRFNDDVFVYIAAFGLFTDVSYETKQEVKNVLGHLAYVLEGTKRLFNIPSYRMKVTCNGKVVEDEFAFGMVTNSRSVGGFRNMVGKQVVFDDGLFEVTLIKTPKNPIALQEIVAALISEQVNAKHMFSLKAERITFESLEEIPWTLDGEFGGNHDRVQIENMKQKLPIVVPKKHVKDLMEKSSGNLEKEGAQEAMKEGSLI